MASSARAKAAPTNHPAIRKARCGTAREERRKDQVGRRAETHSPAPIAFPALREAARRTKRRPPGARQFVRARAAPLRRKRKRPVAAQSPRSASAGSSSESSELRTQFARGAKQRILYRLLGGAQSVANGAQLQALVMLHLEHYPLARRQPLHRGSQPRLNFLAEQTPLGVECWPMLALPLKKVGNAFIAVTGI